MSRTRALLTLRRPSTIVVVSLALSVILSPLNAASAATPTALGPMAATRSPVDRELGTQQKGPGYRFTRAEQCLMRKINRKRASAGLHRLEWDKQIGYVARAHAHDMAAAGGVWHDPNMGQEVTNWRKLGQNTGAGRRCPRIFRSFFRSPAHRSNILGAWRFLGVGATWSGGRLYVQQIFESRLNPGNVYSYP